MRKRIMKSGMENWNSIAPNVPGYAMLRGGTICAKHLPPRNMGKATVRSVAA